MPLPSCSTISKSWKIRISSRLRGTDSNIDVPASRIQKSDYRTFECFGQFTFVFDKMIFLVHYSLHEVAICDRFFPAPSCGNLKWKTAVQSGNCVCTAGTIRVSLCFGMLHVVHLPVATAISANTSNAPRLCEISQLPFYAVSSYSTNF